MHSRNLKVCPRGSQIDSLATLQSRSRHRVWPTRKRTTDMRFLQRLFGEFCSHRFTWPRLSGDGQHYQICLICGTAYEYDWMRMRRTDRAGDERATPSRLDADSIAGNCQLTKTKTGLCTLDPDQSIMKERPDWEGGMDGAPLRCAGLRSATAARE